MTKRVLNVGQCGPDNSLISNYLQKYFDVEVVPTHSEDEALEQLRDGNFDLILLNRVLDANGADGIAILRTINSDPELSSAPTMLISNYPEAQETAVAAGAVPGFGKAELNTDAPAEKLAKYLRD